LHVSAEVLLHISINRLKRDYIKHRDTISETGQGLIDEGRESEFTPGSKLANIWGMVSCLRLEFMLNSF
jgi:hypothetical protein